jgi:acyl-CoA synthetase (AMP-forming)/AMP-acid ligase II
VGANHFIDLRDRVLRPGLSLNAARRAFVHPPFANFNWAIDYFDRIALGNLDLSSRPVGLMQRYLDDEAMTLKVMRDGYYHTGDVASCDADGNLTYVGRLDDVFKSSDYRISPFELESVLIEHPAVTETAVMPSPDALRLSVPKGLRGAGRGGDARMRRPHSPSWRTCASAWRHSSASADCSSQTCRRPSRARSAASSCGAARTSAPTAGRAGRMSSGKRICRESGTLA